MSIILEVAAAESIRIRTEARMQAVLGDMAARVLAVPPLVKCFCWAEAEHTAQQGDLKLSDTVAVDFLAPHARLGRPCLTICQHSSRRAGKIGARRRPIPGISVLGVANLPGPPSQGALVVFQCRWRYGGAFLRAPV